MIKLFRYDDFFDCDSPYPFSALKQELIRAIGQINRREEEIIFDIGDIRIKIYKKNNKLQFQEFREPEGWC